MSQTRQMPCCRQVVESAIVRPAEFKKSPLIRTLKSSSFSTLIPSFLLSLVFSFTSSPVPQSQWATLIRQWHQHKHFKNKHGSRWTSTPRRSTPWAWEMDAPAVYSCSGIAIVFFPLHIELIGLIFYMDAVHKWKWWCKTFSFHTDMHNSEHSAPITHDPASQGNTWKLWFN